MNRKPFALIVLDGWGLAPPGPGNAVSLAKTPTMDRLRDSYPHTTLVAHGEEVGLRAGLMGNSNVGHLNLGAGRVVYQDMVRIDRAIDSGEFFRNPAFLELIEATRGKVHLLGLLSDGGVHSDIRHTEALIRLCEERGRHVVVHAFLDGRDVPPRSAERYIRRLEDFMADIGAGRIATVSGRYYAMDRDKRWDRTERAFRAIVSAEGLGVKRALEAVEGAYERGESDEFVTPSVVEGYEGVEDGDGFIFFNFRADRARQLTRALIEEDFAEFERPRKTAGLPLVTMTRYDEDFRVPVAFGPVEPRNTLGEVIAQAGLRQLRIAETEKYAHVTFFFNGGREEVFPGEQRILVPSPKVATYDQQPEMSAHEVTERVLEVFDEFDFILLNYANPDMVGHTGDLEAAIQAIETVDRCLGRVVDAVERRGAMALVVADHGNAEKMIDEETGGPHTAHTTNPVPCVLLGTDVTALRGGNLASVAPTVLRLLDLPVPREMTGEPLL